MDTVLTSMALVAVPIGLGGLLGVALRRLRRQRFTGLVAAAALIGVPVAMVVALVVRFPLIGLWDALLEGLLLGAGVVWGAHRLFAGGKDVVLTLCSLVASLLVLEVACHFFLPPPPGFPTAGGPRLWLADSIRADSQGHSWGLRSKEIVCSVVYGEQYAGIIDVSGERDILVPRNFVARLGATRRILHIGDSMTFGLGVSRDETFTAALERINPGTQHINGGIPNTAPDAYLLVLRRWLAVKDVDLAVMYVWEANDLSGLDDDYPCCHWQSLLTYGPGGPAMRCPSAASVDFGEAGAAWLRYNSPPPYLVRALISSSAAAANVGAAIVSRQMTHNPVTVHGSEETAFLHLESILRAARDELRAQRIQFGVVVLPSRIWVENPAAQHLAPEIMKVAQRLNVQAFDASDMLRDAVVRGAQVFLGASDPHFSAAGNELIARWLYDRLATVRQPPEPSTLARPASRVSRIDPIEKRMVSGLTGNFD